MGPRLPLFDIKDQQPVEAACLADDGERQKTRSLAPSLQGNLHVVQKQLDELHEEIYKKGGVKPTNAAIDEIGKLIFLKVHAERDPAYRLQSGAGQGKLFVEIFTAAYVQYYGKQAVRELQDAFREISTLPGYTYTIDGEAQTLFPYQEPLRLDQPDVLAMAIQTLSALSLSAPDDHVLGDEPRQADAFSQDLIGCAYDVFLRGKYDNAGGLGTFLTPSQVVDCMVKMAFSHVSDEQLWACYPGEERPAFLIGDICCGTGRFLVRALAEVRQRVLSAPGKSRQEKLAWLAQVKRLSFFGADQAASSIVKARLNFLLFGEAHAQLLSVDDSILDERVDRWAGKFDLLLTNPPFGEGKYDTPAGLAKMRRDDLGLGLGWSWREGEGPKKPLRRADPALLFLDRNLQLLKPGGLLFIVLPDGLLEPAYAYAHRYLFRKAALRAVVSLPKEAFAITGTVAKTSFICLQKAGQADGQVFMAVAKHVGFVKKGNVLVPDPEGDDLPAIAAAYDDFVRATQPPTSRTLSLDPLVVSIPRDELGEALTAHTYHPDRLAAEKTVAALKGKSCRLQELASLAKPTLGQRTLQTQYFISVLHVAETSNVDWEAAASHTPSSKGLRCCPGDIIFSCLNPSKIRVTVIPFDVEGDILCSTEFAILRVKPGEDPYFVALALKSETSQRQIIPMARGTSSSRRRVRERDLLTIILPYPDAATRQDLASQFHEALERARNALALNRQVLLALDCYVRANGAGPADPS